LRLGTFDQLPPEPFERFEDVSEELSEPKEELADGRKHGLGFRVETWKRLLIVANFAVAVPAQDDCRFIVVLPRNMVKLHTLPRSFRAHGANRLIGAKCF